MITQKTAARIWHCYREIETAEKLLGDMAEVAKLSRAQFDDHAPKLKDAFGNAKDLQLGIPSGESGHQLFRIGPDLAISVIRAHIAAKNAELVEANEAASLELKTDEF